MSQNENHFSPLSLFLYFAFQHFQINFMSRYFILSRTHYTASIKIEVGNNKKSYKNNSFFIKKTDNLFEEFFFFASNTHGCAFIRSRKFHDFSDSLEHFPYLAYFFLFFSIIKHIPYLVYTFSKFSGENLISKNVTMKNARNARALNLNCNIYLLQRGAIRHFFFVSISIK